MNLLAFMSVHYELRVKGNAQEVVIDLILEEQIV